MTEDAGNAATMTEDAGNAATMAKDTDNAMSVMAALDGSTYDLKTAERKVKGTKESEYAGNPQDQAYSCI